MRKNLMLVSFLNIGKLLLQSSIAIVIALFTTPERFGLIGFSLPLITFLILVGTAGLAPAIIRHPDLNSDEFGAALTLAFVISVCLWAGVCVAAPFLERGTGLVGLATVVSVLGVIIIPANIAETLRAALERRLLYQSLVKIELAALFLAVVTAITAALAGLGIWALVLYHVVLQLARVVGMAAVQRDHVRLNFGWWTIRPMMAFGSLTLVANLCNFAARNTDNLLIGGNFGSRALGLYGMAYQLMTLPLVAIAWPGSNLLLATLKRLAPNDRSAFAMTVGDMLTFTAALAFPVAAWLSIAFPWMAQHLLPARWRDIAPLLAMLAPAGALQALAAFTGSVLLARDESRLSLAVSVANCVILLGGFLAGVRFGLREFVLIYAILSSIVSLGQLALSCRAAGIAPRSMIHALTPAVLAAGTVLLCFLTLSWLGVDWSGWITANVIAAAALTVLYAKAYPHLLGGTIDRVRIGLRRAASG